MNKKVYDAVKKRSKGRCEICGSYQSIELHHVFGRIPEESELNCIMLCYEHHRGNSGVHNCRETDLKVKRISQKKYRDNGFSDEKIREITGGRIYD